MANNIDKRRTALLKYLSSMPDEGFSWFVIACLPSTETNRASIWPDGDGGFNNDSRVAIDNCRTAARQLLEEMKA